MLDAQPCPRCGNLPRVQFRTYPRPHGNGSRTAYFLTCPNRAVCGLRLHFFRSTEAGSIAAWNRAIAKGKALHVQDCPDARTCPGSKKPRVEIKRCACGLILGPDGCIDCPKQQGRMRALVESRPYAE
jgi:hypothetical protein